MGIKICQIIVLWIREVKEFDMCGASGRVHVNLFISFASSGGDSDIVRSLKEALSCLLKLHFEREMFRFAPIHPQNNLVI